MSTRSIHSGPTQRTPAVPIGAIGIFGTTSIPSGWVLCFGQAISRTMYAKLFGILGTAFGSGDGSTTFNVPDCRGRYFLGKDNLGGSSANRVTASQADNLGQSAGAETHTLTTAEIASHTHTQRASGNGFAFPGTDGSFRHNASPNATDGNTGNNSGGGGAHNNVAPYQTVAYAIKALNL